jgi:antitoxin component HigA of HigAB toxin-antitoxin module/mRNA-degrading endonuclease HigB of HigAB toxin-antitoxin module
MIIVGRKELDEFMKFHADARPALSTWLSRVVAASWRSPLEILERYPRASMIRNGLVVFDIKGNDYRLAVRVDFDNAIVRILKVGTRAEYDKWSLQEAQMVGIIHNDEEHAEALAALDRLMEIDPESGTPEADDLQLLALVIETYEKARWPIGLPDPLDAIRFCMDQQGLTRHDLEPYIGSRARVSEVLSGKRALSMRMIRALHAGLDIPLEVLVQEPRRERQTS